jgi:Domain of unknown function (DUF6916)
MAGSNRRVTISRRDAIRLFAVTAGVVSGAVAAKAFRGPASAGAAVPPDAVHSEKGLVTMTQDLAKLAAEQFEPLVGETFTVGQYRLTLRDVRRSHKIGSRFREQFAIVFRAPSGLSIRSELLPVAHPAIGRHDLLVTQIMDDMDGTALEICFS